MYVSTAKIHGKFSPLVAAVLFFLLTHVPLAVGGSLHEGDWTQKKEDETITGGREPSTRVKGKQRRRMATHVNDEEILHLLRHDPVEMTLEEASDWQRVKRRLSKAREETGWFHRVEDVYVPPDSALRFKKDVDNSKDGSLFAGDYFRRTSSDQQEEKVVRSSSKGKEAANEYRIFERARKNAI
ncbi:hypothetical protein Naga_100001g159 [Nannochloropsis gaditana]|uniref:Uncharacterized protein n=1 Tax=Nannochloropsis gaditana TaxID=72520 RepID=W7TSY8_9STRA|nr:hypothetical protein Naga_100001g159 [Nannochloropsis gaditana]